MKKNSTEKYTEKKQNKYIHSSLWHIDVYFLFNFHSNEKLPYYSPAYQRKFKSILHEDRHH